MYDLPQSLFNIDRYIDELWFKQLKLELGFKLTSES